MTHYPLPSCRLFAVLAVLLMLGSGFGCRSDKPAPAPSNSPAQAEAQSPSTPPSLDAEPTGPSLEIDPVHAMQYTREIFAMGGRWPGSKGQEKTAAYLRGKLKGGSLEEDAFVAGTPAGKLPMRNFIARFPGTREGIIVLASHIDTPYEFRQTTFAGANDGASSTGLLLAIADRLRGKKLEGFSVWLAFLDGEEAVQKWTDTDSVYGSRHLAARWQHDGTLKKVKAFILADMIGDTDLNLEGDTNSTTWLQDMVFRAATRLGYQSHFFARPNEIGDDHIPFKEKGVPVVDLIDLDYGYNNAYWHNVEDTPDKLSVKSLQITGDVILETIRLLNANAGHLPGQTP